MKNQLLIVIEGGNLRECFSSKPESLEIVLVDLDNIDANRDAKEKMINYITLTQHLKQCEIK